MDKDKIFLMGDMVREISTGGVGFVNESQFTNLGDCFSVEFYQYLFGIIKTTSMGDTPDISYSCNYLPDNKISKCAWYDADELILLERGTLFNYIKNNYSKEKIINLIEG